MRNNTIRSLMATVVLMLAMVSVAGMAWGSETCEAKPAPGCTNIYKTASTIEVKCDDTWAYNHGATRDQWGGGQGSDPYPSCASFSAPLRASGVVFDYFIDFTTLMEDINNVDIYVAFLTDGYAENSSSNGYSGVVRALYIAKPPIYPGGGINFADWQNSKGRWEDIPGATVLELELFQYSWDAGKAGWQDPKYYTSFNVMPFYDQTLTTPTYPEVSSLKPTFSNISVPSRWHNLGSYISEPAFGGYFNFQKECPLLNLYNPKTKKHTRLTEAEYKQQRCNPNGNWKMGIFFFKTGTFDEVAFYTDNGWQKKGSKDYQTWPTIQPIIKDISLTVYSD